MVQDWQETSHFLKRTDGRRLHVRALQPPPVAAKAGVPILCLHGLTRNSKDFEPLWPFLTVLGRTILSVDTRGRGQSDPGVNPLDYTLPVYVQDLFMALDALCVAQADFVGTSMGGLITMEIAKQQPDRIRRAVLNDIGPVLAATGLARIFTYTLQPPPRMTSWQMAAEFVRTRAELEFPGRDDAFWLAFAQRTCVEIAPDLIQFDYDPAIMEPILTPVGFSAPAEPWAQFAALAQKPLTVLRGALSTLFEPAIAAQMTQHGPDISVVTVPGVGHAPLLDEPEAVEAILSRLN
jgi:pimeloyl-ACP methyl ester carboxylesterase